MMTTEQDLRKMIDRILPEVTALRHWLHQHPELALHETLTSARIRAVLKPLPLKILPPFMQTDVVALLAGAGPGRNVTLRADIDALPLEEKTGKPYRSEHPGCMHACGHDGHTAMLCGTAMVLAEQRKKFKGSVRFVFQPGEEVVAAGQELVARGALKNPAPDAVLALHGWPGYPAGHICSRPGPAMAAADFFRINIRGRGAHGSRPEAAINPLLTAVRLADALHALPAQKFSAQDPVVLSVCHIESGRNSNIIPDDAMLEGTVRYLDLRLAKLMPRYIRQLAQGICASTGARFELVYDRPYIPLFNDESIVELGRKTTQSLFGKSHWHLLKNPSMGGEDFAYYLRSHHGAMFFLGMGKNSPCVHNPHYDFNDAALKNGILFMAQAALSALKGADGDNA
jgi:amidohydrolase